MKVVSQMRLELRARRWVLVLGVAVGLMSWFLPLLGKHSWSLAAEERFATSTIYTLGTLAATALVLGFGLTAPDLQEGRMGFYLSRPVSPGQIYAVRLLSGLLLTLSSGALVLLPSIIVHGRPGGLLWACMVLAILTCGMMLIADILSTAFRSQSPWLLLDLASWVLAGGVLKWQRAVLFGATQPSGSILLLMVPLGIALITLLLASALKLSWGRIDLHRTHRAQSLILAAGLAVALVSAAVIVPGRVLT